MSGTLCIGHASSISEIILNAVSSYKDSYVNGDAQVRGNHLGAEKDSGSYIEGSDVP